LSARTDPQTIELAAVEVDPREAGALVPSESGRLPSGTGAPSASIAGGAYDAASTRDRELALWAPPMRSADGDLLVDKQIMDVRGRDQARNDGLIANGIRLQKDAIVGEQYLLSSKPNTTILGLDETWAAEFSEEVEEKFSLWGEGQECWADAGRQMTFTDQVRLVVGLDGIGGEAIASVEWLRDRDPRQLWNTAINFIDPDRLSNPHGMMNRKDLRGGVARDDFGRPVGYWFRRAHPGDYWNYMNMWQWDYVAAEKPWGRKQVLHIYEHMRPDQSRGVSEMVGALKETRMTRKFRDIVLQNAVVNASYAATIESELPSEAVFAQLGAGSHVNIGDEITKFGTGYLAAIAKYVKDKPNAFALDGAKIPHLYPGTKLNMRPAGAIGGIGSSFEMSLLRYIATTLGLGAEEFSGDYSGTNYSTIKAAAATIGRGQRARKKRTGDKYAGAVLRLWIEESLAKGLIKSMPRNAPSFYEGLNAAAYCEADWIGAGTGQVDELHETQAAALRIGNGLSSFDKEGAKLGVDWRKNMKQKAREKAYMQKLGIFDDVMAALTPQAAASASALGKQQPGTGKKPDNADQNQQGQSQ
jgi:lambda family phage portal protein